MRLLILLLSIFFVPYTIIAQDKTVYMSVDVSGSMEGDKYNLANYMAQMITALMDEQDELYFSICSDFRQVNTSNQNRSQAIQSLQRRYSTLNGKLAQTEFGDIKTFIKIFKNKPDRDQRYFIVGDGYWYSYVDTACEDFQSLLTKYPIKVYFLETMEEMSEHGEFGECLDDVPFATQLRSSDKPQTIINNCLLLATSLFGVSNESVTLKKEGTTTYSFKSQLPIKKFYLVYQEEGGTQNLPSLESAISRSMKIPISRQATVSTENLIENKKKEKLLSGQVVVLEGGAMLAANEEIKLNFNKKINLANLKIFPVVDVSMGDASVETALGIPRVEGDETVVCLENDKAKLIYKLFDGEENVLPKSLLEQTKTTIKTSKGEYSSHLVDDQFECEIPLSEAVVEYTINSQCVGYFNIISNKKKIVKSKDCDKPVYGEMKTQGDIHISELMSGEARVYIQIVDKSDPSKILDPRDHEIRVTNNYKHLFEKVTIGEMTDTKFEVKFKARNSLCECFIPDAIEIEVHSEDKLGRYVSDMHSFKITIDKSETSKLDQCKWVIISLIVSIFLIIYMSALKKKKRFKKGSMIRYQYFGVGGIRSRENVDDLRPKGLFAWLNRWFMPFGAERVSKSYPKAGNKVFSFSAGASAQRIEIPKNQYDPKQMSSIDYDRDQFERRDVKTFSMSDNTMLKITLPAGAGSFQLRYDRAMGESDDTPSFKIFASFVITLATVAIAILSYLLITSLF